MSQGRHRDVRQGRGGRPAVSARSTCATKADSEDTNGAYVLPEEAPRGDPTPLHSHTTSEETFHVLSSQVAVWLGGEEAVATAGSFLLVPRGVPHALRRVTPEPCAC